MMEIDTYISRLKNFLITNNDITVNLNSKILLKKILSSTNISEEHYIVEFPEFFIQNYNSLYKMISNYSYEYDVNLSILPSLTLQNYLYLNNLNNDFSLEKVLNDISMIKIDSLEEIRSINDTKLNHLFIESISLQTFEVVKTLNNQTNIIMNIANADMLYKLIENKRKSNMKIMLEFNVYLTKYVNGEMSFNMSSVEGFSNMEIIECIEFLKQNNCLYLLNGINIDCSILQKNIYDLKNAITQISKLVGYLQEHYSIDIEIIYLKNLMLIPSTEESSPNEIISNLLYIINEILPYKKNQKVLLDINNILFDNTSIYVSTLEKKQDITKTIKIDENKINDLKNKFLFYFDSNDIDESIESIRNINHLYNLGYINLETFNMLELALTENIKKEDNLKYLKNKYFINSLLVDSLQKLPIFSIDTEEQLYLKEISIFEKFNFNKHIEIKAYINDLEKQTIIQFLDKNIKDTLKINTYIYQSKNNVMIKIN